MRAKVDVVDCDSALRSARHDGLNAWVVSRAPNAVICVDGPRERVETWLRKSGYGEGEYETVFD